MCEMNQTEILRKNLAIFRKQRHLTQEQLANELGLTFQAISKWENGLSCPDISLLPQLAERFGDDILRADGTLDRRLLADRAFATPEGKRALDALTHPEILRRIRAAKQAAQEAGNRLFVLDGAVIVGTEAEAECDRLAVVTAPFATSVARIAARDGISPEMAARRLNAQTPEETLRAHADYVLCNDGALEALEASANTLCEQLLAEAAGKDGVARPF